MLQVYHHEFVAPTMKCWCPKRYTYRRSPKSTKVVSGLRAPPFTWYPSWTDWNLGSMKACLNIGYPVGYPKIPWWIRLSQDKLAARHDFKLFLGTANGPRPERMAQTGDDFCENVGNLWYFNNLQYMAMNMAQEYSEIWANYHHQIGWDKPISQAFKIYSGTESFANACVPFVMQLIIRGNV